MLASREAHEKRKDGAGKLFAFHCILLYSIRRNALPRLGQSSGGKLRRHLPCPLHNGTLAA